MLKARSFLLNPPKKVDHQVYEGTVAFTRGKSPKKATHEKRLQPKPVAGPRLELTLTAPTLVRIPKLIMWNQPIVSRVDEIAAKMGLMPRDWVREIFQRKQEAGDPSRRN